MFVHMEMKYAKVVFLLVQRPGIYPKYRTQLFPGMGLPGHELSNVWQIPATYQTINLIALDTLSKHQ